MIMAYNGNAKIYKIWLTDGRSMAVRIESENRNHILVRNKKGYGSIISKDLIKEVTCLTWSLEDKYDAGKVEPLYNVLYD